VTEPSRPAAGRGYSDPRRAVAMTLDAFRTVAQNRPMRWITGTGSLIELLNLAVEEEYGDFLLRVTAADGTEIGSFATVTDLQNNVDLDGLRRVDC
jgi:hypothetical protein